MNADDVLLLVGYHVGAIALGWASGRLMLLFKQIMDSVSS